MTDYTKITGGTVYDPTNGIDGRVCDLWIARRPNSRGAERSVRFGPIAKSTLAVWS